VNNERCYLIGITPGSNEIVAVDCSAMKECRNDEEHFRVLQKMVAGYIEHVTEPEELKGRCICYVNEEGLLKGFTVNIGASFLLERTIVGRLCVCKGDSPDTFFTKDEAVKLGKEITEIIKKRYDAAIGRYKEGELKV